MQRFSLALLFFLIGCTASGPDSAIAPTQARSLSLPAPAVTVLPAAFVAVPPTLPVPTPLPAPTATLFPLPSASPVLIACSERKPAAEDLWVVITASFGISPVFMPQDLVRLDRYLPYSLVCSPQIKVRQIMVEPLVKMLTEIRAAGLKPIIRSGYRSYNNQVAVRQDWQEKYPDRADLLSAIPGHSEHQLGLAVDFGSPELAALVGDPKIEFHTAFAETSEGKWLAENAYKSGFTLSFPPEA